MGAAVGKTGPDVGPPSSYPHPRFAGHSTEPGVEFF